MEIEKIKDEVISEIGRDPFGDSTSWDLLKKKIPEKHWSLLTDRAGASKFLQELLELFPADNFA